MKFSKIPVVIEATQWFKSGDHAAVIQKTAPNRHADEGIPWVETLEGGHVVTPGDWIITGVKGEHYPCKPDIFALTYKPEVVDAGTVAMGLTPADINAAIVDETYHAFPDTTATVCMLTLRNGAKVVGYNYGAIDPSRHSAEIGRVEARKMAVEKVWELEGYLLRERLAAKR